MIVGSLKMVKINKHIEIVRSSKPKFSSMGLESCEMIRDLLSNYYETVGITIVNDSNDIDVLIMKKPDLAFLGLKKVPLISGPNGNSVADVWLSEYLDDNGINYSGSSARAISLDFDKTEAKQVVEAAGLKTSGYFMAKNNQFGFEDKLPLNFPLFLKPPNTGGGKGIGADSVVRDYNTFNSKVESIQNEFSCATLAEEYLTGREFSVAILDSLNSENIIAMPIELITEKNNQGDRILGRKIKADDTEHVLAVTDSLIKKQINTLAISVFKAIGARDYGRIDIRLDMNGVPHFLEANLVPGLAFHNFTSYFTSACWINRLMDYQAMILHIVELGLSRADTELEEINDYHSKLTPSLTT